MPQFIPKFEWQHVLVQPWTDNFSMTIWIVVMGFFVAAACGIVGNYLLLRRMALVGDAISHSVLPGLVVAFLIFRHTGTWTMFVGALGAGLVTVFLIEFIHRQSRVKPDAATCIAFTSLFAFGVVLMSLLETKGNFHLDAECVLYGELAFVSLEPPVVWYGVELCPPSVLRMGIMLLLVIAGVLIFYKELLVTSFDPGLSRSLGLQTTLWHYGLMGVLSLVVVAAFESVGAILAVAMLVVPPMFAAELSMRLPLRLFLTCIHAALSALIGLHMSVWLNCSTAGAIVFAGSLLFAAAWLRSLLLARFARQRDFPLEDGEVLPVRKVE